MLERAKPINESVLELLQLLNELLYPLNSASRAAGFGDEHLALLVDDKDTALGALGCLLQVDGADEGLLGVAEERVGQLLLVLEVGVGLRRVCAKTVDGEAAGGERLVGVAEEAGLGSACRKRLLLLATCSKRRDKETQLCARNVGCDTGAQT
jgi:hypothetical protein